jgi:hypothetical protein
MTLDLEALLIAFIFLLPGFLTSRLVEARTPAVKDKPTALEETLESFLRSTIIHLIIAPVFLLIFWLGLSKYDPILWQEVLSRGISAYYSARPFEALCVSILWLAVAFLLALLFGSKWDPIKAILENLATSTGLLSEDLLYYLRRNVEDMRTTEGGSYQLWLQARLKNGYTYRGELMIGGYRDDDHSRELLLANVKFFPYPAQTTETHPSSPKLYDYAIIDFSNCESVEVIIIDSKPSK